MHVLPAKAYMSTSVNHIPYRILPRTSLFQEFYSQESPFVLVTPEGLEVGYDAELLESCDIVRSHHLQMCHLMPEITVIPRATFLTILLDELKRIQHV